MPAGWCCGVPINDFRTFWKSGARTAPDFTKGAHATGWVWNGQKGAIVHVRPAWRPWLVWLGVDTGNSTTSGTFSPPVPFNVKDVEAVLALWKVPKALTTWHAQEKLPEVLSFPWAIQRVGVAPKRGYFTAVCAAEGSAIRKAWWTIDGQPKRGRTAGGSEALLGAVPHTVANLSLVLELGKKTRLLEQDELTDVNIETEDPFLDAFGKFFSDHAIRSVVEGGAVPEWPASWHVVAPFRKEVAL